MTLPVSTHRTAYLNFVLVKVGERTKQWEVRSMNHPAVVLGRISWYSRWRQYVFYPAVETLFNVGCLFDLARFLQTEMDAWRAERKRAHQSGDGG